MDEQVVARQAFRELVVRSAVNAADQVIAQASGPDCHLSLLLTAEVAQKLVEKVVMSARIPVVAHDLLDPRERGPSVKTRGHSGQSTQT